LPLLELLTLFAETGTSQFLLADCSSLGSKVKTEY